uniref:Uncharacterized protein n=1 Tax=Oryza meridionalis TaxID=40149 RepID=A0A0E0E9N8_9ORYZ
MARTELVLLFVHGRDIDGAAQGLMLHKDTGVVILSPATADATTNKKRNHGDLAVDLLLVALSDGNPDGPQWRQPQCTAQPLPLLYCTTLSLLLSSSSTH